MDKKQILRQAAQHLNSLLSKQMGSAPDKDVLSISSGLLNIDGPVTITSEDLNQTYNVLVQPWAPQKNIEAMISQLRAMPAPAVLFADFVNPVMAGKLRQRSITFVDCAGNCSFKSDRINIYVKGKKPSRLRSKRMRGRAFNSAGLKLIFALFNQPHYLQASYRDISNKVNIALGSVGPVIDDLYSSGYILDDGSRRLVNKKRLFERWVDGYLEKLRPKQIMACYTSDDEDWWKNAKPDDFHGVWGGEVIVARSTPYMAPESISLYFTSDVKHRDFASHYGLREDEDGEICVYKSFWSPSYSGEQNIDGLNPMIVYADIVDSINPGSWDVAKTFYGEAVAQFLQD
ncbi:MAG: type IV toxin-antitoxin system AbiEi family antitoxin [Gammaproteobacteria bacterium]|nr:type IV toxin-antitoxin system AbiEi family antitoxin [Gammaproteobacteria bacterium]